MILYCDWGLGSCLLMCGEQLADNSSLVCQFATATRRVVVRQTAIQSLAL